MVKHIIFKGDTDHTKVSELSIAFRGLREACEASESFHGLWKVVGRLTDANRGLVDLLDTLEQLHVECGSR